ncbi:MAG TPA: TonB-dependent receptor [Rhodanobacter sp.]|nr:TonB-dependent receptor [Rhodanobacter sp.]
MALTMRPISVAILLTALAAPCAAYAQVAYSFNLPAQELSTSLRELGRQAQINVIFDPAEVKGRKAHAVSGRYEVGPALKKLLDGSGFTWKFVSATTVVIQAPPKPSAEKEKSPVPVAKKAEPTTLQAVTVLGTNLTNLAPATPVITIDAARIQAGGYSSLVDVLRYLPQNFASQTSVSTSLNEDEFGTTKSPLFSVGADSINLRGLGSRATLILVNGHRIAGSAQTQGAYTDISSIPLSQVERVEVMTAGASAIYGADAVGGVVNIVLKKNYSGTVVEAGHESSATGADISRLSAAHTFGWASGYLTATAAYRRSKPADVNKLIHVGPEGRGDFTDLGGYNARTGGIGQPGLVYKARRVYAGMYLRGAVLGVVPSGQDGTDLQPGELLPYNSDTYPTTYVPRRIGPEVTRPSLQFTGEQNFGKGLRFVYDLGFAKQKNIQHWQPSVGSYGFRQSGNTTYIPATNKYNHFGEDLLVGYSYAEEFSDMVFTQSQQQSNLNYHGGLTGKLPFTQHWTFDVSAGVSREWSRTDRLQDIYNLRFPGDAEHAAKIDEFLNNVNVFGDGSDPAVVEANRELLTGLVQRYKSTFQSNLRDVNAFVRGDVFPLPGGKAQLVVGGEYQEQDYQSESQWSGYTTNTNGQTSRSLYAELGMPLLHGLPWAKDLTLSFAARYGNFRQHGTNTLRNSTFTSDGTDLAKLGGFDLVQLTGAVPGTENFEAGPETFARRTYSNTSEQARLTWAPIENLRFRATWGQSFLTPAPTQMFGNARVGNSTILLDRTNSTLPDGYTVLLSLTGPNPNLKPQIATTRTIGVDFTPPVSDGLAISVTYTDTSFENYIGDPLAGLDFQTGISNINELPRGVFIEGDNGIMLWDARTINFAGREVRTVDTNIDYAFGSGKVGDWQLSFNVVRTLELEATTLPSAPTVVFSDSELGPSKWAGDAMLVWQKNGFMASAEMNYNSPFRVLYPRSVNEDDNPNPRRHAGSYTTTNLQVGYKWQRDAGWLSGATVRLGVKDVFDRTPPFVDNSWGFVSTRANTRGRVIYLNLTKAF